MESKFAFSSGISETAVGRAAVKTAETLVRNGFKAFFVGGSPRDMLLGKSPYDIDIATSAKPDEIRRIFPKTLSLGASFGVISVCTDGFFFETATLREEREYLDGRRPEKVQYTDDEKCDVERRDFTINALLYDPLRGEIIDYAGGVADLARGLVRTVGDARKRFSEDYLRILRGIRFKARLAFELDPETRSAMCEFAPKLELLSRERVRNELEKMLLDSHPSDAFRTMEETGVLKIVLPEIHALSGIEQPPEFHPEGDVFTHTMLMLEKMCHPSPALAWSVLLHDTGKAVSRNVTPDGIVHFYGHESTGGAIAENVMKRLRASKSMTDLVSKTVREHMRYATVDKMKTSTWKKMMADPGFAVGMELHRVDCLSCHGRLGNYVLMLDRLAASGGEKELPPPLLNGRDLISLGIRPGPEMKTILNRVRDLQLEGKLSSRADAFAFLEPEIKT